MTTTLPPPPPSKSVVKPPDKKPSRIGKLGDNTVHARVLLNFCVGVGKTSLMAHAKNPVMILAPEESGFLSLRSQGLVPDIPCVQAESWDDMLGILRSEDLSGFDTICLDAISSFVSTLRLKVMKDKFNNDAAKYAQWSKGEKATGQESICLIPELERLAKQADVIVGCHPGSQKFKNQDGDEYNIHAGDLPPMLWESLKRWADAVLFGTFYTAVEERQGKGQGKRVIYTEARGSIDAKNHYQMPPMIEIKGDAASLYPSVFSYIGSSK